jgi:hypothetical protein
MTSVVELLGCELAVPDQTTVRRHAIKLPSIAREVLPEGPLHAKAIVQFNSAILSCRLQKCEASSNEKALALIEATSPGLATRASELPQHVLRWRGSASTWE